MALLININLILQLLLSQLLYTLWNIFHENERNFIIVMSVTKFPLIGWSIIKMIFNDLTFDKAQLCLPSNFMKAKYQKSSELEKDLILNQQTFTFSKTLFCLALKRSVGPGETHHSKQRERGRSHLYGEVFVESKTLCPPGTAHCCSALGRATFGKGVQARCGSSFFFIQVLI